MTITKEYTKLDKTFNLASDVEVVEEKSNVIQREKPARLTQDDIENEIKSPGWIRYQKKLKR